MPDIDRVSTDIAAEQLADRLRADSERLAEQWLDRLNDLLIAEEALPLYLSTDRVPDLIAHVADYVQHPGAIQLLAEEVDIGDAAESGVIRRAQRSTVRRVLAEYQALREVLRRCVTAESARLGSFIGPADTAVVLSRIDEAVRTLEQQSLDSFVGKYVEIIERQTRQLRGFSRLISHEIRRPLGVLQVVSRMMTINDGDVESIRVNDIFDRSLRRLIEVTDKLERQALLTRTTNLMPSDQHVDLSVLVSDLAGQLDEVAAAHGVQLRVEANLPTLKMDPGHAEIVFLNLLANGIKHSDASKAVRFVEVVNVPTAFDPTVVIRDNGIGLDSRTRQQIFRELGRGHAQRDPAIPAHSLGIGLAVVRECMDEAGGTVRLESREGEGTAITLTWPSHDSASD